MWLTGVGAQSGSRGIGVGAGGTIELVSLVGTGGEGEAVVNWRQNSIHG